MGVSQRCSVYNSSGPHPLTVCMTPGHGILMPRLPFTVVQSPIKPFTLCCMWQHFKQCYAPMYHCACTPFYPLSQTTWVEQFQCQAVYFNGKFSNWSFWEKCYINIPRHKYSFYTTVNWNDSEKTMLPNHLVAKFSAQTDHFLPI